MGNEKVTENSPPTLLGEYAGFVTRLIAWIIDNIIIAAVVAIIVAAVTFILQAFPKAVWLGLDDAVFAIAVVVGATMSITVPLVYYIVLWMLAGQTIGKWLMGVRIIRTNGERLRFRDCVLRLIGYLVSAILLLGYLWILVDNRRQGFHDKIAHTFVVYSWPESVPVKPLQGSVRRIRVAAADRSEP